MDGVISFQLKDKGAEVTYNEQLQNLANRFMRETGRTEFTTRELARWAIENGLWKPQPDMLIRKCAEEFSRAMREEYLKDPQGRRVRIKHVATVQRGGEQIPLWADMRLATRQHMETAFQQRRQSITGDCKQLKNDLDSYNENFNSGAAIQIVFDFRDDLAEAEALAAIG
jgi:hypothetical protein